MGEDRSLTEIAVLLDRPYGAVSNKRQYLRRKG